MPKLIGSAFRRFLQEAHTQKNIFIICRSQNPFVISAVSAAGGHEDGSMPGRRGTKHEEKRESLKNREGHGKRHYIFILHILLFAISEIDFLHDSFFWVGGWVGKGGVWVFLGAVSECDEVERRDKIGWRGGEERERINYDPLWRDNYFVTTSTTHITTRMPKAAFLVASPPPFF